MHLIQLDMGRRNGTKKSKKSVPPAPYIAASVPVESSVRHDAAVETPDSEKRKSKGFGFGLFGYGSVSKSREPGGDITDENENHLCKDYVGKILYWIGTFIGFFMLGSIALNAYVETCSIKLSIVRFTAMTDPYQALKKRDAVVI